MEQAATVGESIESRGAPRPVRGVPRAGRIAALSAGGVGVALVVGTVVFGSAAHLGNSIGASSVGLGVACLAVGVLLAARRPDNAMGWCLLATTLFLGLTGVGGSISVLDYRLHHTIPLGSVGVLLQPSWAPAIVFLGLSFLIFPDGHFSSRAVKWATWLVLAIGIVWMAGAFGIATQALLSHAVRLDHTGNLLAIDNPRGSWAWWGTTQYAFFAALGFSWVVWLVQQVPRYRVAGDEERHQLKWLLSGGVAALACGFLASLSIVGSSWLGWVGIVGLTALPVTIAIGVTKFHLYAIDRLISRTLAYLLLTGVVIGVYVGVITVVTKGIGFSSPVAVAASTLIAAALFNPLRKRIQRGLDRRFNRAHYDAERTVSNFAAWIRDAVDPARVSNDLLDVVRTAFEPASAGLWIRPESAQGKGDATYGSAPGFELKTPSAEGSRLNGIVTVGNTKL